MRGVENVDSLTWNLHKLSGITQQCAALVVREPLRLREVFSTKAEYLFQPDKNNAHYDAGDLTFQCARRNDALKAWLTWKARGEAYFGARVEHAVDLATRLEAWIRKHPEFVMAVPRTYTHVCFWWVPPALRPLDPDAITPRQHETLHELAPWIKNAMQRDGNALVGYQPINGGPNTWRMLFINPAVTWTDTEATMNLIARLGADLS